MMRDLVNSTLTGRRRRCRATRCRAAIWSLALTGLPSAVIPSCNCATSTDTTCESDLDCPTGYRCDERRLCSRVPTVGDGGAGDAAAGESGNPDRRSIDAGAGDVAAVDRRGLDAGACFLGACPAPTTCFDRGNGSFACLCHDRVCQEDVPECLPDSLNDGGIPFCCQTGATIRNCGGECADLETDPSHCGACGQPAIIYRDAGRGGPIPLSSRCADGEPRCGIDPACVDQVCAGPDGGDAASATCVGCRSSGDCLALGAGEVCCNGGCLALEQAASQHCGCSPDPTGRGGLACSAFQLGAGSSGPLGRHCILPDGGAITAANFELGTCGCNADGLEQCGATARPGLPGYQLYGLCDPATHACVAQSRSNCGRLGGVCDIELGGPFCIAVDNSGLGKCGCEEDLDCRIPVYSGYAVGRVIANKCSNHICGCSGNRNSNYSPCNGEDNVTELDCCATGCVDLSSGEPFCGSCGTVCQFEHCQEGICPCSSYGTQQDGGTLFWGCPTNGGGGGQECLRSGWPYHCVCLANSSQPCPPGTYCNDNNVDLVYGSGSANGCCDYPNTSGLNRCVVSEVCSDPLSPVLCTDTWATGTKYACCPTGSSCRNVAGSVQCATP
ncbi:MAG: hypothetical protein JXR83_17310 [Deltaproteobacteria bacterium]|nr:hypothetical protein [Deltaproteobacteria bacterium]